MYPQPGEPAISQQLLSAFDQLADSLSEKGYGVIDHFLSREEFLQIKEVADNHKVEGNFKKAGIGTAQDFQIDKQIRGDYIRWIDPAKAAASTQLYLGRMRELMHYINRTCFLSLKDVELHYTVYPVGTVYKRHLDQFRHDDHRRLSVICYLNADWQPENGGQLRMYLPQADGSEETVDILPNGGKLACFRSDLIEHEVLPATRERYSLTGWMLDQHLELTFL
jgi:SM-20-related protein